MIEAAEADGRLTPRRVHANGRPARGRDQGDTDREAQARRQTGLDLERRGLARGADQTRAFDDAMNFFKRDNFQIINLVINDDTAVKRLMARGRNDDTEEAIRRRLAWTKTDVLPQLELLQSRGRTIHEVDGEPDVETIHKNILSALGLV